MATFVLTFSDEVSSSSFILIIYCDLHFLGKIDDAVWRFFLTGGVALDNPHRNPAPAWLQDKAWSEIVRASNLNNLDGFMEHVQENIAAWKKLYDSTTPHSDP